MSHSFNYMVDDKSDLETVLKYMASIFSDSSIDELFVIIHSRVSKCCNIDTQRIPQISDIKETNPKDVHLSKLLQGYNYEGLKPIKRKTR